MNWKYLIFFLAFLVSSCGTRKRIVDTSIKKTDVITYDNFDLSKVSDKTSIVLSDDFKFTMEPIDPTLPIIYRHDTIYNSKVTYQRVVRDSIVRIKDTVYIKEVSSKTDKSTVKEKKVQVESERGDVFTDVLRPFLMWMGAAIFVGVILWIVLKRKN